MIILPPKASYFEVAKFVQPVRTALLNDAERSKLRITSGLLSRHGSVVPNPRRNDKADCPGQGRDSEDCS